MEGECANLWGFCESVPRLLARIVAPSKFHFAETIKKTDKAHCFTWGQSSSVVQKITNFIMRLAGHKFAMALKRCLSP